jgi:uncharacterized membrane protein YfcA
MLAQLSNPWWVFVLLGVAAGVISGSLGLGSGTIVVPVLVLVCHYTQKPAQGMALAVMVPMALVGALRYRMNGIEMDWLVIALIICGAMVGTLAGTELATRLSGSVLRKAFAIFLVVVAVKMFTMSPKVSAGAIEGDSINHNTVDSIEDGDVSDVTRKQ